jgi:cytoskeletal protein CcmA (bactofilin family)
MFATRRLTIPFAVGLFTVHAALIAPTALAQRQGGLPDKFRSGQDLVVASGETIPHDLYVAAGRVRVDGRVEGDLFAAGGQLEINGPVTGDLVATGGQLTVAGPVGGDIRAAGGQLRISSAVGEDVLATGGSLALSPTARIGQDVIFAAGQTEINGTVAGSVQGTTGDYTRQGSIAGSEFVTVQEPQPERQPTLLEQVLDHARRYVGIVLVGGLLLWLVPRVMASAADLVRERPLPDLGVGILAVIGFCVACLALLAAMLVLAIPLGILGFGQLAATIVIGTLLIGCILTFAFALIVLFVAAAIVGLAIGRVVLRYTFADWNQRPTVALLLGVLLIVVVTAVPVLGGLINAIAVLLGLGALMLMTWWWLRAPSAQAP